MSINSMANVAVARRPDYPPAGNTPKTFQDMADAAGKESTPANNMSTALKTLETYVPTETLTLYVALVAAIQPATNDVSPSFTVRWIVFGVILLLTPITVWVAYATKVRSDNKKLPLNPTYWPWWEMIAGTIAYVAWAIGLPSTPFAQFTWYSASVAAIVILVTSSLLGMVAGLFQQPLKQTDPISTT